MEKKENAAKSVYEVEQELFKTCPKMADPAWWDNGSDEEVQMPEEINKKINENAEKARNNG